MSMAHWRQVYKFADKHDLEVLHVCPLHNQLDVEVAMQALVEIDKALQSTRKPAASCYNELFDIRVSARRKTKNKKANVRTHWRK